MSLQLIALNAVIIQIRNTCRDFPIMPHDHRNTSCETHALPKSCVPASEKILETKLADTTVRIKQESRNNALFNRRKTMLTLSTDAVRLAPVKPGAVAQLGRAPESHSGGQGFEPPQLHYFSRTIIIPKTQCSQGLQPLGVSTWKSRKLLCLIQR